MDPQCVFKRITTTQTSIQLNHFPFCIFHSFSFCFGLQFFGVSVVQLLNLNAPHIQQHNIYIYMKKVAPLKSVLRAVVEDVFLFFFHKAITREDHAHALTFNSNFPPPLCTGNLFRSPPKTHKTFASPDPEYWPHQTRRGVISSAYHT